MLTRFWIDFLQLGWNILQQMADKEYDTPIVSEF